MSDGDAAGVGAGTEESGEVPTEGPGHGRGTGGARTNDACTAAVSRIDSLQTGQFVRSLSHESTHWTWNEWPHGSSRHCEASWKAGIQKTAVRFVSLLSARCPLPPQEDSSPFCQPPVCKVPFGLRKFASWAGSSRRSHGAVTAQVSAATMRSPCWRAGSPRGRASKP